MKFIGQMGTQSRVYAVTSLSYHQTNNQATAERVLATKRAVLLLLMMLMMMTVKFTETEFVWEERTSTHKILPSDWLTGKSVAFSGLGIGVGRLSLLWVTPPLIMIDCDVEVLDKMKHFLCKLLLVMGLSQQHKVQQDNATFLSTQLRLREYHRRGS